MLNTLHYDDVDITGFAGVRERILVMDSAVFSRRPDSVWPATKHRWVHDQDHLPYTGKPGDINIVVVQRVQHNGRPFRASQFTCGIMTEA